MTLEQLHGLPVLVNIWTGVSAESRFDFLAMISMKICPSDQTLSCLYSSDRRVKKLV